MGTAVVAMPAPVMDSESPAPFPSSRAFMGPGAITAVVALWATRSYWWPGRYVIAFDSYTYSGPNLDVTERALQSGRLALWNDVIFGGVTHLGNPQAGTLYPPRLLGLVFETNRTMGILVALHVVLLGLGMVALARRLGFGAAASTLAGVASVLSGMVLTKATQFEQILVLAWTPWLLVALHATIQSSRPLRSAAGLAAVTAAMLLAGHPQLVYESAFLAAAALLGFVLTSGSWRRLGHVAAGVGLGAVIAAPQLVGALVATRESSIAGGRTLAELRVPGLAVESDGFAMALLGTVLDRDPTVLTESFERIAFVGVGITMLAAVGLVDGLRRRDRRWWVAAFAAAAAIALAWSQGPASLAFRGAFKLIPGFDLGRVSARWLVVVALVLIVLAAAGVDALFRQPIRSHAWTAVVSALVGTVMIAFGLQSVGEAAIGVWWAISAVLMVAALTVVVVVTGTPRIVGLIGVGVVVALELGAMSLHSVSQGPPNTEPFTAHRSATTDWLRERDDGLVIALTDDGQPADYSVPGLRPNANVLNDIRSIDGYDGGVQVTERWANALRRFSPDPDITLPMRNALTIPLDQAQLARLGVRYVLIDRNRPAENVLPGWVGPVVEDERFAVWENPEWIGEAVAWPSARETDPRVAADLLRESITDLSTTALAAGADGFDCPRGDPCTPVGLPIERDRPEHLRVVTDLPHRTIVSIAQQYSPGWHAELDGERVDLVEVDGLFLGVEVPAGRHAIDLEYRPGWLTPTLVVSVLAVLATVTLAIVGGRRRPDGIASRAVRDRLPPT